MRYDPSKLPLTRARLTEVLRYDAAAGSFHWVLPRRGLKADSVAGTVDKAGYRRIIIEGRGYYAHLLAWLWVTGSWPATEIDHENLKKDDNRFTNLRPASRSLNMANGPNRSDSLTGVKGIQRRKNGRYRARIMKDGKHYHLGYFDDPGEANSAYLRAAQDLFGQYARGR